MSTAPGHGEDDFLVGKQYGLPVLCPVDHQGKFTAEITPYAGMKVEKPDLIIKDLEAAGLLIKADKIKHSYPHCWRCKNPIIFRATEQWFASIDGFRQEALAEMIKSAGFRLGVKIEFIIWLPIAETGVSPASEPGEYRFRFFTAKTAAKRLLMMPQSKTCRRFSAKRALMPGLHIRLKNYCPKGLAANAARKPSAKRPILWMSGLTPVPAMSAFCKKDRS